MTVAPSLEFRGRADERPEGAGGGWRRPPAARGQPCMSRVTLFVPGATVIFRSVVSFFLYLSGNGMVGFVAYLAPDSAPPPVLPCTTTLYSPAGTSEERKCPSSVRGTGNSVPWPVGTRVTIPPLTGWPL